MAFVSEPNRARVVTATSRGRVLSGKWSAITLFCCLLATAIAVPVLSHRPHWVEIEQVISAWWAIWSAALSFLLYNGCEVSDDAKPPDPGDCNSPLLDGCCSASDSCCFLPVADSIAEIIAAILLVTVLCVAVQLLVPFVAFWLYVAIRGMLARVLNDRHDCARRLGRSIRWGVLWAALYTGPLALIVWLVHVVSLQTYR